MLDERSVSLLDEEPEARDVRAIGGGALLHLQVAHKASPVGQLNQGHQLVAGPSLRLRCGNHAIATCEGQQYEAPQEVGEDGRMRK